jgi:diacylglycerol kinase family enzyme
VKEATVEREKAGCIHIDGEPMNEEKILKIKAVQGKLKIIVPADEKRQHSSFWRPLRYTLHTLR